MKKRVLIFLFIVILLGVLSVFYPYLTGEKTINPVEYERETIFVERVIDGDTLVDSNGTVYRLLGIDTPERGEEFYQEAKEVLQEVENKQVEILRDWENRGKYGRKLRYIFYENRLINVEIVEKGLAISFIIEDLKYKDKIIRAENFAKENCLGIWEDGC
tara:strand:+ start:1464 stop:1943 length:480 start_codon:yes stop_codon:yes gene_type:complete